MKQLFICWLLSMSFISTSFAETVIFDFPEQERQYQRLITELRCPKCQNQSLAGSNATISQNLRRKTYELVKSGKSDAEIRNYMTSRYGEYISYQPPVTIATSLLWFLPPLLLCSLLLWWGYHLYRKQQSDDINTM